MAKCEYCGENLTEEHEIECKEYHTRWFLVEMETTDAKFSKQKFLCTDIHLESRGNITLQLSNGNHFFCIDQLENIKIMTLTHVQVVEMKDNGIIEQDKIITKIEEYFMYMQEN